MKSADIKVRIPRLAQSDPGGGAMTPTDRQILERLNAPQCVIDEAATYPTLRAWWAETTSLGHMMWLVDQAHTRGALPRRRLVGVAVACVLTVAHLLDESTLPYLATVSAWASGNAGVTAVDLVTARKNMFSAYADAIYTARDAYAADAADAAYAADVTDAAIFAAYAAADADADADPAMVDVIRDTISIDEVCTALGLDPDQGVQ